MLIFTRSNTVVGDRVHASGMVVSRILKANIPVQNGIVHLIDKPLMVVARSLYDYLMEEGRDPDNRLHEFSKLVRDKGGAFSFTNQWGMTKFNCFFTGNFFVLNETLFSEGFIALLFLLGFEISGIGCMAFFT